jgi:prepilin-type N-terminal cleavage/methylation domain-containing protein
MRLDTRGFTLIEMLVVVALLAIIMIGLLNLLDTSSKISVVQTELADTQENVRFAAYHIMRTARMMGSAAMPIAANVGGSDIWMAAALISNHNGGTITTDIGTIDNVAGSDVLVLRGFFEIAPMFTDPNDVTGSSVTIYESNGGRVINTGVSHIDIDSDGNAEGLKGRGIFFMGKMDQHQYAVGQITADATMSGTAPDRSLSLAYSAGTTHWSDLNQGGTAFPPNFDVYRVGVLDSYIYYVDPDFTLQRLRADDSTGGGTSEPVAINIGSLQVAFGVDLDGDNDIAAAEWLSTPTVAQASSNPVLSMRITVLGRTNREVPDWVEPAATFQVEDMDISKVSRFAKWRRIQVEAALRNYLF